MSMRLRQDDTVRVMGGDQRGTTARLIRVFPRKGTALVQGVNLVWKHQRRSANYPHGARIEKEAPVVLSKLMLVCPLCSKPTRVAVTWTGEGASRRRGRKCRKCGQPIPEKE